MLFDFHTHTQPTVEAADEFFSWLTPRPRLNRGSLDDLFARMAEVGVSRTLIVPWLPAQDLVEARVAAGELREAARLAVIDKWRDLNAWAARTAAAYPERITTLVGVDPVLMTREEVETEVALRLSEGASGIKIAPMFLGVAANDPRLRIVWELARAHKVFVLSECGARGYDGHGAWGAPQFFDEVCREFPDVTIQLAHLGMGAEHETARLTRTYPNVYADLSLRLAGLDEPGQWTSDQMLRCIRDIGAERVVYGTNYPIVDVVKFRAVFDALDLTPEERELISWRNAARVLGQSE
jgi:predicted TIM-barrel fold metal-dependent hydrolase